MSGKDIVGHCLLLTNSKKNKTRATYVVQLNHSVEDFQQSLSVWAQRSELPVNLQPNNNCNNPWSSCAQNTRFDSIWFTLNSVSMHNSYSSVITSTLYCSSLKAPCDRTYQYYQTRPFTRAGQILSYFFINQELCVNGIWSLRFSWRTLPIFLEAETSAQASCGENGRERRYCNVHTQEPSRKSVTRPLRFLHTEGYKLNKEQTDVCNTSHNTDTVRNQ